MTNTQFASRAGQLKFADLTVNRIGLGTNRITNVPEAHHLLKSAVELGVNFIDTAHLYTGGDNEVAIGAALAPYAPGLVIASKGGYDNKPASGSAEELRSDLHQSLKSLKTDCITLYQLHRVDPQIPIEESVSTLKTFQQEGKIRHIGLSEVTIDEIKKASKIATIVSVQNEYNLVRRQHEAVIDYCEENGLAFIPWFPLGGLRGDAKTVAGKVTKIASRYGVTERQIALAWLLKRSPAMLPIPGTLSSSHLKENLLAGDIDLSQADFDELSVA